MAQAIAVEFDAEGFAGACEITHHGDEILRGIGIFAVFPDAYIVEDRGVLGLAQIGGAGEERHAAIGTEVETLEKAKARLTLAFV
jgi:hypothetical protein